MSGMLLDARGSEERLIGMAKSENVGLRWPLTILTQHVCARVCVCVAEG